jgi:hypothetical protein
MEKDPVTGPSKIRKSRLVRFSLRFLLLAITTVAIAFGILAYHIQRAKRERIAVLKIEELGGRALRIRLRDGVAYVASSGGKIPEPRFKWIHQLLGEDYFTNVPLIDIRDSAVTADKARAMIPHLQQIRLLKGINEAGKTYIGLNDIGNPNVDGKLIDEFKSRLPQCVFSSTLVGRPAVNMAN